MTMVPPQNLFKQQQQQYDGYGGCGDSYAGSVGLMKRIGGYEYCSDGWLGSDLVVDHMAEDESRTSSVNEAGSSSKDIQEERDERWLQLGLGGYSTGPDHQLKLNPINQTVRRGGLVELDLLPSGNPQHVKPLATPIFHMTDFRAPSPATNTTTTTPNLFFQHPAGTSLSFPQPELMTWGYRPNPWNLTAAASSSSSLLPGPYYPRPYQHQTLDIAYPSSVVDAPSRPHSGIWFVLQASQNQAKEPFLPQIPKSYLRIKDGKMTVGLLMKYLVNKLRLNSESEIEIRCRGEELVPMLTLQHVRDNIWSSRDAVTLLPDSSTTDHVMILHYGRTA